MNKTKISTLIVLVLMVITLLPLAVIWSINTLFTLDINYGWKTWLAVLVLIITFGKKGDSIEK